ncbi:glycine, alanine and asparagine-rich protein-like [Anopheles nili]|uniref:glycine, alanine and asparagine-rich protein-like n=1 Tax=Anopheles nili TaxID=185578 RepID=UPI00237A36E2|nr:glycine, alanine and asparagine-rich protein-like [Anopheles nili]
MRAFGVAFVCVAALVAVVLAEAPLPGGGGYPGGNGGNGGYGGNGGGGNGFGGGNGGGAGPLLQKPTGQQTTEGLMIDPQLLEQVKMVLLQHESESASNGGSSGPSSSYGPPRNMERVVGLMLEQPVQSIQLAEYWQGDQQPPSNSYGPPSGSYGAPQ